MSKNLIYGAGALGIIGIAVYIYQEHKKAKKTEQESFIYIDDETTGDEKIESEPNQEKETKKNAISEKIANVSHKIGKTIGTVALRIGAKYPKAVKFVCRYGKFWPAIIITGCSIIAAISMRSRWKPLQEDPIKSYDVDNDHGIGIRMTTRDYDKSMEAWNNTDLSKNFYALSDLLKTLNFVYGEQYYIQEKESFKDEHPEYDATNVKEPYVIRQIFNTNAALNSVA